MRKIMIDGREYTVELHRQRFDDGMHRILFFKTETGGILGTVDLKTGRVTDYRGRKLKSFDPRGNVDSRLSEFASLMLRYYD